jgi:hypothetical protein
MEKDSELHISDLKLPPGVRALQDAELLVATVREIEEEATAPAEAAETGAAEPEVIGRKKEEEGAEGAAGAAAAAPEASEKK